MLFVETMDPLPATVTATQCHFFPTRRSWLVGPSRRRPAGSGKGWCQWWQVHKKEPGLFNFNCYIGWDFWNGTGICWALMFLKTGCFILAKVWINKINKSDRFLGSWSPSIYHSFWCVKLSKCCREHPWLLTKKEERWLDWMWVDWQVIGTLSHPFALTYENLRNLFSILMLALTPWRHAQARIMSMLLLKSCANAQLP